MLALDIDGVDGPMLDAVEAVGWVYQSVGRKANYIWRGGINVIGLVKHHGRVVTLPGGQETAILGGAGLGVARQAAALQRLVGFGRRILRQVEPGVVCLR